MVTKEQVWKGLRLQLPQEEIKRIFQADEYETDDYFDFDLMKGMLYKARNKEIDFDTFLDWCVLLANCLPYTGYSMKSKIGRLYNDMAYFFDGISFMNEYDEKSFMNDIAALKYYDFLVQKAKKKAKGQFLTNGVERILLFDHVNRNFDTSVYKVIIKDYNAHEWEIRYVDEHYFTFDENVNYSFESEREFEKIFDEFFDNDEWREVQGLCF